MSFDNLAPVRTESSESETVVLENVLGNYFQVLGISPALGRLLGPQDVPAIGDGDVAVVSWSYWNSRLHRDPAAIGRKIWVHDVPKTIVGVAPRSYVGPRLGVQTDVWLPREKDSVAILARLKPGVPLERAQAEMRVLFQFTIEQRFAKNGDSRVRQMTMDVESASTGMSRVRDQFGKPLTLLLAVVGLLLLLACINIASLLLARSAGRQRELAVRVGLGASRLRLLRQSLTESLLLSGTGTLVGLAMAWIGAGTLVRIMASGRAHERVDIQVVPDLNLLLFAAGVAVLTGLLFGMAPAWHAFRAGTAVYLRQTGAAADTSFWRIFGKALVAAQVALSILMVTSAALFADHLGRLRNLDLGFRSDGVLLVSLDPQGSGYTRAQLAQPYRDLLSRFQSIPGVRSTALTACTPVQGCGASRFVIAEGFTEQPEARRFTALSMISPGYFETLGIPLQAGRDFTFSDAGRTRVAIVSESMARYYFPGQSPIGRHVRIDSDPRTGGWFGGDQPYEIVGVAGDAKYTELRESAPRTMYLNMFQEDRLAHQFALHTSVSPAAVAGAVRQIVRDTLKSVRIARVTTLSDQVDAAIVPERLIATLSASFGLLGAALAGIGLYGLLAYSVARRIGEIGIRMALGATAGRVSRLILRDAVLMVGMGTAAGIALVFWSRPFASALVQDLKTETPWPLLAGGAAIAAVALLASSVPVLRAARVDPVIALRHD